MNTKDISGRRFGRLLVICKTNDRDKAGHLMYKCRCDCGNIKYVNSTLLQNGSVRSCGCLQRESRERDITGQTFGFLTAIKPTAHVKNNSRIWEFRCICGKTVICAEELVISQHKKSCGCKRLELNNEQIKKARENVLWVDDTNINRIKSEKLQKNNTSGTPGVQWHKSMKRWQAFITVQKKEIYLGTFVKKEDAVAARKSAEEKYFKPLINKWSTERELNEEDIT